MQAVHAVEGGCGAAAICHRLHSSTACRRSHTLLAQPYSSCELSFRMWCCVSGHWRDIPVMKLEDACCMSQVAEISRVLQPGGVFVASTFLKASAPLGQLLNNDDVVRPLNSVRSWIQTPISVPAAWAAP